MKKSPLYRRMTTEQYLALPEDSYRGYDLVRGGMRQVREPLPSFTHGSRRDHIVHLLWTYLDANPIAHLSGECNINFAADTARGPDIVVVRNERYPRDYTGGKDFNVAPDLIIEIRSPSERAGILRGKLADYFAGGTSLVWVVEERKRRVTIHRPNADPVTRSNDTDILTGDPVLPGFSCSLEELFR